MVARASLDDWKRRMAFEKATGARRSYPRTCCLGCKVPANRVHESILFGVRYRWYICPECFTTIKRVYYLFMQMEGATYIYRHGLPMITLPNFTFGEDDPHLVNAPAIKKLLVRNTIRRAEHA